MTDSDVPLIAKGTGRGDPGPGAGGMWARMAIAASLVWRSGPWTLLGSASLAVLTGAWPVAAAWLTKLLLDELTRPDRNRSVQVGLAAGLAVTGLLSATLPHLRQYLDGQLRRKVGLRSRDELFTAVNRLTGLARFETPQFHDRIRMAEQAAQGAALGIVMPVLTAWSSLITAGGFIVTLTVLSPVMTAVVLIAVAPAIVAEYVLSRQRAAVTWSLSPLVRRQIFFAGLMTSLSAAKEVRLFGLGDFLRRRLVSDVAQANEGERVVDRRELRLQSWLSGLSAVTAGAGLVWVVAGAGGGSLSVGDVAVFIAAVAGVQSSLTSLVAEFGGIYEALLLLGYYRAVVRAESDLPLPATPLAAPALRHGIELRDVWFRYHESHPWVLRGVDLFLPAGQAVALVGLNGSGKSTMVKLLCRFYDPQRGAILWDGVDIRDLDPASLRERMAVVFQDYVAYDFTASDNIGMGDLSALTDRDRIRAAADRAGIHTTLADLPRGYDTMLSRTFGAADGDGEATGVLLSGGQWQRVALARAYLRQDRDLIILDEPSAGIDAQAEHEIHADLRRYRTGRTSLLISHRLNTIRDADLIVVLAEGQVVERGSHGELMAVGATYAKLFALQAEGYQLAESPDLTG